jgi:hypothetical protein
MFGQTPGERAKEIGAAQRTLSRKANAFEQYGMQSLFSSGEAGGERETSKTLPEYIRQLIVDLHKFANPSLTGPSLSLYSSKVLVKYPLVFWGGFDIYASVLLTPSCLLFTQ